MNAGEQRQLRDWADRLCAADDSERRAMGRAIAMLLDRVDELERELSLAGMEPEPGPMFEPEPELDLAPLPEPYEPLSAGEDTQQLSLRDRLRMATDHLRDRGGR